METSSQKTASQTVINHYAKQGLHHVVRTGNLFVIHFTKDMFVDNGTDNVYFNQCLKVIYLLHFCIFIILMNYILADIYQCFKAKAFSQ